MELPECPEFETLSSIVADDFIALNPIGPAYNEASRSKESMLWKLMAMREIVVECEDLQITRPIVPPSTSALMQGSESDID